ncbi:the Apo forms of Rhodotorula Graminis D-mandelate dehydrogenase At 1.8a [Rhodotorula sp. JG-1b]|nr:the Apo forms of Rhodotorula Graminis D-mandelate dehydrogenase At 1.8a [Rhodotorula sp. JG-1b]
MTDASKARILVLGDMPIYQKEQWDAFCKRFEVIPADLSSRENFQQSLRDERYGQFDGIVKFAVETGNAASPWDAELIALLPPTVKLFAAAGAGFDYMSVPDLNARGIAFANSRGAGDTATSDIGLFLILATFRLTSYAEWGARTGDAQVFHDVHLDIATKARNPRGKTLACVGLGAIQREIARKAKALGMEICYYDVAPPPPDVVEALEARRIDSLAELAGQADCVSVSVPYMESTHHLIDSAFFAAMKPGSRIINTARGPVIDEGALVAALKSGHLLSAGLDVHEFEPQVSKELIGMKQVTLTTHIGGVAQETHIEFERLVMENTERFLLEEKPLLTPVGKHFAATRM